MASSGFCEAFEGYAGAFTFCISFLQAWCYLGPLKFFLFYHMYLSGLGTQSIREMQRLCEVRCYIHGSAPQWIAVYHLVD